MKVVIHGAGAIGGVVGACLHAHGHDVTLVARGRQLDALRRAGLQLATPDHHVTVRPAIADHPAAVDLDDVDAVLVAVKSQDTAAALHDLAATAPAHTPIVCLQNGIANERIARRLFDNVYGVAVQCPAAFLEPGRVIAYAAPTPGILDVGRYPDGVDDLTRRLAAMFRDATFASEPRHDIMRWKHRKLVVNTGNAVEAIAGPTARAGPVGQRTTEEAERVLADADIPVATRAEDAARRGDIVRRRPVDGVGRPGGSMWQSLARRVGTIESDHLNGEIVRIAGAHGGRAPVNALLQQLCRRAVDDGWAPGAMDVGELEARLRAVAGDTG